MAIPTSSALSETAMRQETPIGWPLRVWMGVEVMFGLASILTIFLRPENTTTNFAWPIKPDVMAATLGAFYLASAIIFILPLFARTWESVRPMVIPTAIFSTMMLLATVLHWAKFSTSTNAFYVWLASYVLPPPIFAILYWWHQRRSASVGRDRKQPIARWAQRFLRGNGMILAGVALSMFVIPMLLQRIGPWAITPLTGRALCGWLIGVGLLEAWLGWEGDWQRMKLSSTMLIVLPFAILMQLLRFRDQVQWTNLALWLLLADTAAIATLMFYLWLTSWNTGRPGVVTYKPEGR